MKRKEVYLINILIAAILLVFTYFIIFGNTSYKEIMDIVRSVDKKYILFAIFIMLLYFLLEAINLKKLVKSLNQEISLKNALKARMIGFFFSSITPAATGGEPMQVYSMKKDGVSFTNATIASLINICSFQIVIISLAIISLIHRFSMMPKEVLILFSIGTFLNASVLTIMLIFIFNKKLANTLVNIIIKMLTKLKLKNKDKLEERINKALEKYSKQTEYIKKHKKEFVFSTLRIFMQMSLYYLVPYIIYRSFGMSGKSMLLFFELQAILFTSVSSIPLPGSIGISESAFLILYKEMYSPEYLRASLLLTRGINFYLFVIISLIITIITIFKWKKD